MSGKSAAITKAIVLALLGIGIGFLGELMPDEVKNALQQQSQNYFGISYLWLWGIFVVIAIALTVFLLWQQAPDGEVESETSGKAAKPERVVVQKGKKSVYVEKNKGDINIK